MRPLFKVIIAVFIILIALAVATQVRGDEYTFEDTPQNNQKIWTLLVNGAIDTGQHYMDSAGNDLYARSAHLKHMPHQECTLTYNHSNRTLMMTIARVRQSDTRITGEGKSVSAIRTHAVTTVSLIDLNADAKPDLVMKSDTVVKDKERVPAGTTAVFDTVPPVPTQKNLAKKLAYSLTWATWEEVFLNAFGHTAVEPKKKERL